MLGFGLNRRTGVDTILTSWKSQDDPKTGDCLYQLNPNGSPQFYLYKDSTLHRRSWPWPWCSSVDTRSVDYNINFVYDQEEISYSYFFYDPSIITRLFLNNSGSSSYLGGTMVMVNGLKSGQHPDTGVRSMDYAVHIVYVVLTI
jgi:hypothetical protein